MSESARMGRNVAADHVGKGRRGERKREGGEEKGGESVCASRKGKRKQGQIVVTV